MPTENPNDSRQRDYVERGSDEHMALLGLERDGEEGELRLSNPEDLIRLDPTGKLLEVVTEAKVRELHSEFPEMQSEDPGAPFYAPPMFVPEQREDGAPSISGIV